LLEIIRTDEQAVFGTGLSISQNISIGLFACGMALWWYLSRQPRGVTWPLVAERPRQGDRETRRQGEGKKQAGLANTARS
jgi:phosphatidylglycerol:prolipoprotein diacylglycerol transferase